MIGRRRHGNHSQRPTAKWPRSAGRRALQPHQPPATQTKPPQVSGSLGVQIGHVVLVSSFPQVRRARVTGVRCNSCSALSGPSRFPVGEGHEVAVGSERPRFLRGALNRADGEPPAGQAGVVDLGFGGEVADFYHRYRRGYPPAVLDTLAATFGLTGDDIVVDLGCGTGQLTLP